MARIKTFQGSGPNPNVPFAGDIPRPQFIGQEESAIQRFAGNINKEAQNYATMQKKQNDTASIAQADAAKIMYNAELDGQPDLYDEKGNLDIALYKKRNDKFYDTIKNEMSGEAFDNWRSTQTVLDARRLSSFMSENMKRTREANRTNTLESMELMANNSITGTFDDMQDSVILIKKNLDQAIESRVIELSDAIKVENTLFKTVSKSYLDTKIQGVKANGDLGSVNLEFENMLTFVAADPYGVYAKDSALKEGTLNYLASKRLDAVDGITRKEIQAETRANSLESKMQKRTESDYEVSLRGLYAKAQASGGSIDPVAFNDLILKAGEDRDSGNISERGYHNIVNYSSKRAATNDRTNFSLSLTSNEPEKYTSKIIDDNLRSKARRYSTLTSNSGIEADELKIIAGYDKKNEAAIIIDYASKSKSFGLMAQDPRYASLNLGKEDLSAIMAFKYLRNSNPSRFYTDFAGAYGQYLSAKGLEPATAFDRVRRIEQFLADFESKVNEEARVKMQNEERNQGVDKMANPTLNRTGN